MNEPKKQRTPAERHEAWLAWRRRGVDSYGDVCACKIGAAPTEQDSATKCCSQCTGCNQRIKKGMLAAHHKTCVAYKDQEDLAARIKPGDEFVTLPSDPDAVRGGHWTRCFYCREPIHQRFEEWHWRNNCDGLKQKQEAEFIAGVHATERDVSSGGRDDRSAQDVKAVGGGARPSGRGGEQRVRRDLGGGSGRSAATGKAPGSQGKLL